MFSAHVGVSIKLSRGAAPLYKLIFFCNKLYYISSIIFINWCFLTECKNYYFMTVSDIPNLWAPLVLLSLIILAAVFFGRS